MSYVRKNLMTNLLSKISVGEELCDGMQAAMELVKGSGKWGIVSSVWLSSHPHPHHSHILIHQPSHKGPKLFQCLT